MATVVLNPASGTDDAHVLDNGSGYSDTGSFAEARSNASDSLRKNAGVRFLDATIPIGATIDAATLQPYLFSTSYDDVDVTLVGDDVDDAATFSSGDTPLDRIGGSATTASATWSATGLGTGYATSPEIKTIVQEIVDRAGWASGNAICLLLDAATGTNRRLRMRTYDNGISGEYPKLDVTYTVAAGGGGVVAHGGMAGGMTEMAGGMDG